MKKKTHGGSRKGAGRPKLPPELKKEPTTTIRVKVSKLEQIKKINNE